MAVQAGIAVDPVLPAATASAAATTAYSPLPAATTAAAAGGGEQGCVVKDAVVHPAVAVQFLQELAAFGQGAAAGVQHPLSQQLTCVGHTASHNLYVCAAVCIVKRCVLHTPAHGIACDVPVDPTW